MPQGKFKLVPLGANDQLFKPIGDSNTQDVARSGDDEHFHAVYYGSFVPAHGTQYIIEAARLLARDKTIHFELIGKGGEREKVMQLARDYSLSNVSFPGFLDDNELVRRLNRADICLASFGITPQSLITVHNKVFEILAMARPLIVGDAPAIRRYFKHGEHLYFCERENAQSLANAISILRQNTGLREAMARKGHDHYRRHFTVEQIGAQLEQYLFEVSQNGTPHTTKVRR
jgi:glycosyltransferase involved in cell wall biosynthesis